MGKQKQTVSQFLCILISAYIVHSSSYLSASKHGLNCLYFSLFVQPWSLYEPSDGPLWLLPHYCLLPLAPHSCCDVYRHTCILVKAVGTWDDFFFYIFFVFKVNIFFQNSVLSIAVFYLHVCVCTVWVTGACRDQTKALGLDPELELPEIVSHVQVLGTELGPFAKQQVSLTADPSLQPLP